MQRSNDIKEISNYTGTPPSPFPLEKRNVVYTMCGEKSGSNANKQMQKMRASATLSTPSVAASGATTVWANGPAAPPTPMYL